MNLAIKELSTRKLYLVALSGGADSVALALMMKEQGLNIHALHCNFHLRGEESNRDENFVRQFCTQHNIPIEVKHFNTLASAKEHKASIEMEARELRYAWFAERACQLDAEAICVAHHMDDQAETLLMNLIRGTGLQGLSAMSPDRTVNGLRIIRPLLNINKEEILEYLHSKQQDYVTDSTNLERDAMRNRIRLDLMPMLRQLNPNVTECLARTADNVRMELDKSSQESHYHRWLAPLGFTRSQVLDIYSHRPQDEQKVPKHTGRLWHSPTHTLLLDRGEWVLREKADNTPLAAQLLVESLPKGETPTRKDFLNKEQAFIDADKIKGQLCIRALRQGDRFTPYGMKHGSKLVSDYLTDRKVNLLDKAQQLVVIDSATSNIVWIVGREIDHHYRLLPTTSHILRLQTN